MDVFEGVDFVRLRSMQHGGAYLHAAKDGRSIRLHRTGLSWSYHAVWAVQRRVSAAGTPYVLLRGAYGRYLGGPDASTRGSLCPFPAPCRVAAQRDFDEPEVLAIMWRAVATGRRGRGAFLLHDASGRYLRANSRCLRACRSGVSVSSCSSVGTAVQWAVEAAPRLQARPYLPIARDSEWGKLFALVCPSLSHLCVRWFSLEREIRWVRADDSGAFSEEDWASLRYTGRHTIIMKGQVVNLQDPPESASSCTLCVRAGRYGQPSPLSINLPHSREPLDVVIFRVGSRADDELIYPDVMAPEMARAEPADDNEPLI
ncbi:hypothetical protein D1007_35179 [Hordeum vulgare]|nr:hypothetical protein D1007_35179 [Hordeum vulgare]